MRVPVTAIQSPCPSIPLVLVTHWRIQSCDAVTREKGEGRVGTLMEFD